MKSRVDRNKYLIHIPGESKTISFSKSRTDRALSDTVRALDGFINALGRVREEDPELFRFLFGYANNGMAYGTMVEAEDVLEYHEDLRGSLCELRRQLTEGNDKDVPDPKDCITLEDLGFVEDYSWHGSNWVKELEEDREHSVMEEIILRKDKPPLRRIRTTEWDVTDYGRSSRTITYKILPIGKRLALAIENTRKGAFS